MLTVLFFFLTVAAASVAVSMKIGLTSAAAWLITFAFCGLTVFFAEKNKKRRE